MRGPVFVVGSMRSGSTMLRLMLDSHPRIAIPAETGFMGGAAGVMRIPGWQSGDGWYERLGWSEAEVQARLREFYDGMFRRFAEQQGKARWGDKTPFHTDHMPLMGRVFPDAGFVGIVRHPGAVAASLHRRFHYRHDDAVTYWVDTNKRMLAAGLELGDRFVLCRYEDLVVDGEGVLRPVLELLGEPWAPEVLDHHRVQRQKGTPRAAEGSTITSDPVDASRARAWESSVSAEHRRELGRASVLAEFLGYDVDTAAVESGWDDRRQGRSLVLTGQDLADRTSSWPRPLELERRERPLPLDVGAEELAARLVRAEAALERVRSRRAVVVVDAWRRVQYGRSRQDVRAALRTLRSALRQPR